MTEKSFAKNNDEFDRRFDAGEDIHELIDMSQATVTRPGRKVRLTLIKWRTRFNTCSHSLPVVRTVDFS
jgi:hypothetical protein